MKIIITTIAFIFLTLCANSQKLDFITLRKLSLATTVDQWESLIKPFGFKLEDTRQSNKGNKSYEYFVYKKRYIGKGLPSYYEALVFLREANQDLYAATESIRYLTYDGQQFDKVKEECTNVFEAIFKKDQIDDDCLERIYQKDLWTFSFQNCTATANGYTQYIVDINYKLPF